MKYAQINHVTIDYSATDCSTVHLSFDRFSHYRQFFKICLMHSVQKSMTRFMSVLCALSLHRVLKSHETEFVKKKKKDAKCIFPCLSMFPSL